MSDRRVLVTGMSGLIGGCVRRQLQDRVQFRALNRRDVQGVETVQADISDMAAIEPAFRGVDTVIHLAALVELDAPVEEFMRVNHQGTYNVFECARRAGVRRVIFASSGATVSGWESEEPYKALVEGRYSDVQEPWPMITHESPVNPMGLYGASKVWGEAIARYFVTVSNLSILCVRIGLVRDDDRPASPRDFSVWCSQRDIAQMIERCYDAGDDLRYDLLFAASDNRWGYRDLTHSRDTVGFVPQDRAEDYR